MNTLKEIAAQAFWVAAARTAVVALTYAACVRWAA